MSGAPLPPPVGAALVRELLARGLPFRDRVRGGSMAPTIPAGVEILVEPRRPAECAPGDVVLVATESGGLTAHRLLLRPRAGRYALTKGDRCPRPDPPTPAERLLGRVVGFHATSGAWVDLRTPLARARGLLVALAGPWHGVLRLVGGRCR